MSERSDDQGERLVPFRHENHRKPATRREFLAQGLIGGAGLVFGPSLFGLLAAPRSARAQMAQCNLSAGAGRIPFLCFDLAGGANVAGSNVLVGGPGGPLDPLSEDGYRQLGLPATMLPQLPGQTNLELGLPFHADSAFLRGILSKTSPATRANVNGSVICARSENDTANNPHNPTYGIARAGAAGQLAVQIGSQSSVSGGNSQAPASMIDPALRPVKVDRATDATGLVDTGKLVSLLDQADATAVMRAVEELAEQKLVRMSEAQAVEDLMRCGYVETTYLVSTFGDPTVLDPRLDPDLLGAANSIFTSEEFFRVSFQKTASVAKLVVNGFAGAGTVEFGGYDYHDSTRATGERQDFTAGQAMGAALEYAARRGRQLMLYVFSDGSVNSTGEIDNSLDGRGKGIWKSDDSQTAAAFLLVYDPAGRPQLSRPSAGQLGWYRANGDLETGATRVSNNVDRLAEAIVLNYLALHDEVGRLSQVLPGHGLGSAAEIDSLVAFAPIRAAGP